MPEIRRLITYHDADHHRGIMYQADNWHIVTQQRNTTHDWRNRPGRTHPGIKHRIKWERQP